MRLHLSGPLYDFRTLSYIRALSTQCVRMYYMADRTAGMSFRLSPELKAALERAAEEDARSVSSLVIKVLTEWAKANGHLSDKLKKR